MIVQYRVVDLTTDEIRPDIHVTSWCPEAAAEIALGLKLVRSGNKPNLAARVYCQGKDGMVSMVRLYRTVV
ncbi:MULTISPECIES: hypothetical protein, partial [Devosia]|uniref:hypothetical protein n=1 Tax=Devosia TaxID=46913 RepID=UPI002733D259